MQANLPPSPPPPNPVALGIDPGLRNMGVSAVDAITRQILFADVLHPYGGTGDARKQNVLKCAEGAVEAILYNDKLAKIWHRVKWIGIENQCFKANKKLTFISGFMAGAFQNMGLVCHIVGKSTYFPAACTGTHRGNKAVSIMTHRGALIDFDPENKSKKKLDDMADSLQLAYHVSDKYFA